VVVRGRLWMMLAAMELTGPGAGTLFAALGCSNSYALRRH
jgi:hypothetical protein